MFLISHTEICNHSALFHKIDISMFLFDFNSWLAAAEALPAASAAQPVLLARIQVHRG